MMHLGDEGSADRFRDDGRLGYQLLKKEILDWSYFITFVTDCVVSHRHGDSLL
jgi:hypothetical protein